MDGNSINTTVSSVLDKQTVKAVLPDTQATLINPDQDSEKMELIQSDQENVVEAVNFIKDFMQANQRDLEFSIDTDTSSIMVTVRNRNTGDIIRKMPVESMREIVRRLDNVVGLLFNESV